MRDIEVISDVLRLDNPWMEVKLLMLYNQQEPSVGLASAKAEWKAAVLTDDALAVHLGWSLLYTRSYTVPVEGLLSSQ